MTKIRRVLRDILENESYQVADASTGMEALQHIKEQDFDAIFCDIKMPEMDGIETLEAIRKESDVPVIMLSGHGTIETAVEAIKKGAFDFIPKPPDSNRLLITLRKARHKKNRTTANAGGQGHDCQGGTHQREGAHHRRERHG